MLGLHAFCFTYHPSLPLFSEGLVYMPKPLYSEEVRLGKDAPHVLSTTGRRFRTDTPNSSVTKRSTGESQPTYCPDEETPYFDSYGFRVTYGEKVAEDNNERDHPVPDDIMRKWVFIINNWNSTSLEVKKKYCRKGIPQQFRRKVWRLFLLGTKGAKGKAAERGKPYSYYSELPLEDTQLEGVIERDLDRTFPTHRKFDSGANGEGQQALRRMLRAYANYNRGVGYCQGMGFLAATLLLQINEEERAFWCFCSLMEEEEYNLKSLYEPGFPMLQCYFSVFEGLMKKTNKKVYHHVREVHGVESSYYATHWFLTLFTYYLNFGLISRIWDMFLCEGWKIIFRFALALLKIDQQRLLGAATETELLMVLKDIQENKEPAKMLDVSLKIKFTTKYMNKLKKSYLDSQQRKK